MPDNQRRILEMLSRGKVSVDEAARLLSLVEQPARPEASPPPAEPSPKQPPKYLRVVVQPVEDRENDPEVHHVNVRVPMALIRAGIKLSSLIPHHAADEIDGKLRDHGVHAGLHNLKPEDIETLLSALSDTEVTVDSDKEKVRVFVE